MSKEAKVVSVADMDFKVTTEDGKLVQANALFSDDNEQVLVSLSSEFLNTMHISKSGVMLTLEEFLESAATS